LPSVLKDVVEVPFVLLSRPCVTAMSAANMIGVRYILEFLKSDLNWYS
jgi:hypothetical protein